MLGYGYNWVFAPKWLFNITVSTAIGYRYGYAGAEEKSQYGFSFMAKGKMSFTWNHKNLFAGIVGKQDMNLYANRRHTFVNSMMSLNACIGYRFF